jgi:UDP-glucuronate decarboxylase
MDKDDGRVLSNFVVQALSGKPITIYGSGKQTRSFCYVDDLITGIIAMMATPPEVTGPVNLGNPGEFTIKELAEKIIRLTDSKSKLVFCNLPKDDPERRRPDISKARSILAWEPKVKLEDGLRKTVEYFAKII